MQNRRVLAVVAVAAAAAVTAGGLVGLALRGEPGRDPSPSSATGSERAGDPSAPVGSPSASPDSRPGTTDPTASAGRSATTDTRGGVESLPETPGASPSGLPGLAGSTRTPLPTWDDLGADARAARGRLVPGYPDQLLPAAPRATILTSSLSPSTDRVQLALVARRDQGPAAVLQFYRARLARAGFKELPVAAVGGAAAASFVRGDNRVVVTVDPGRARTYSVQATFVTDRA